MKLRFLPLAAVAMVLIACEGFKDAMTAHVDVAAKAGSQELSVQRLGSLLAQAKVPANHEIATTITNLWVDYELLADAAAHQDSLTDPKLVDQALWSVIAQERMSKWHEQHAKTYTGMDTTNLAQRYEQGEMLAASHILLTVPPGASQAVKDSVHKKAEALRRQVTDQNFADLARKNSQDPSSAARGGSLGLFPKGMMVKQFEDAVLALKPGEISPVVETQFGYHIIRRSTFPEVKDDFGRQINTDAMRHADSLWIMNLESSGNVKLRDNALSVLRDASKDLDAHANDDVVLATSTAGPLTLGRLVKWVDAYPQKQQIEMGLKQAPDSQVTEFIKNVERNELVLHEADSANVQLDSTDLAQLHSRFSQAVTALWDRLGVTPKSLADSGKTAGERERIAATRADQYLDKLMSQQAQYVAVPPPIEELLRAKYSWKVNDAALQAATDQANKEKAKQDSVRAKSRPPSEVPLGPPPATTKRDTGAKKP
ncbi:MAG TPA: peptidylprolyl isomerase [Gemmatimonadaceae bacterium]|nr:peptidylprolyl isomerase [Gemmatimonadaceae bacterium]